MKKLLATALLLTAGLSTSAHAGFISGTQVTDGGKTVNLQGLEWMPLTYTAGMSRDQVEAAGGFTDRFGGVWNAGDWRYADRQETQTLLLSLWGGTISGVSTDNADGAFWFLNTFGGLGYDTGYGSERVNKTMDYEWATAFDYTNIIFGGAQECPTSSYTCSTYISIFNNRSVTTYGYTVPDYEPVVSYIANSGPGAEMRAPDEASAWYRTAYAPDAGSLLVRRVNVVPAVSSPSAISLFALGLGALLLRRRKTAA